MTKEKKDNKIVFHCGKKPEKKKPAPQKKYKRYEQEVSYGDE